MSLEVCVSCPFYNAQGGTLSRHSIRSQTAMNEDSAEAIRRCCGQVRQRARAAAGVGVDTDGSMAAAAQAAPVSTDVAGGAGGSETSVPMAAASAELAYGAWASARPMLKARAPEAARASPGASCRYVPGQKGPPPACG